MMLHNEARNLLVQAYSESHDAKRIAQYFHVGVSTVYHLAEKMRKTGSVALQTHNRGRKRILNEEQLDSIRKLEELRETLKLQASYSTVERAVRKMGFRYKKKTVHASERDRLRCAGKT